MGGWSSEGVVHFSRNSWLRLRRFAVLSFRFYFFFSLDNRTVSCEMSFFFAMYHAKLFPWLFIPILSSPFSLIGFSRIRRSGSLRCLGLAVIRRLVHCKDLLPRALFCRSFLLLALLACFRRLPFLVLLFEPFAIIFIGSYPYLKHIPKLLHGLWFLSSQFSCEGS